MTVISTNVASLVTQNAIAKNDRELSRSMAQLSTGFRINKSADDAAGLAIVSNMTADIRGLDVSIRNANDAVSMIQTADGALGSIGEMLQRMRELAVQSSNGTYSVDQRSYLDAEFQQLKSEINRTALNAQWNGKKILTQDPVEGQEYVFQVGSQLGQTISITLPDFAIDSPSGTEPVPISTGELAVDHTNSASVDNRGTGIYELTGDWYPSDLLVGYGGADYKLRFNQSGQVFIEKKLNGIDYYVGNNSSSYSDMGDAVSTALKLIPDINNNFNISSGISYGVFSISPSNSNSLGLGITFAVDRNPGLQPEIQKIDGDLIYVSSEAGLSLDGDFNAGDRLNINVKGEVIQYTVTNQDVTDTDPEESILGNLSTLVQAAGIPGLRLDRSNSKLTFVSTDGQSNLGFSATVTRNQNPVRAVINYAQDISDSKVLTPEEASSAIEHVDNVLRNVSSTRAVFGATINRITYAMDNLANTSTNLNASRSRIRDADYAKTMSELARAQIIQQAATAMLAQANSSKQAVLKLIQG